MRKKHDTRIIVAVIGAIAIIIAALINQCSNQGTTIDINNTNINTNTK